MAGAMNPAEAPKNDTHERVEWQLLLAEEAWKGLPEVEAKIDGWDLLDQLVFIEEWPLEEMRLERLERHAKAGEMTEGQLARYEALDKLVARNQPIIQRLRNS